MLRLQTCHLSYLLTTVAVNWLLILTFLHLLPLRDPGSPIGPLEARVTPVHREESCGPVTGAGTIQQSFIVIACLLACG